MPKITLEVEGRDRGASRLIDSLTKALQGLGKSNADNISVSQKAAQAAREQLAAAQEAARQAKQSAQEGVAFQQQLLGAVKLRATKEQESSAQIIGHKERETAAVIAGAKTRLEARNAEIAQATAGIQKQAQAAIQGANAQAAAVKAQANAAVATANAVVQSQIDKIKQELAARKSAIAENLAAKKAEAEQLKALTARSLAEANAAVKEKRLSLSEAKATPAAKRTATERAVISTRSQELGDAQEVAAAIKKIHSEQTAQTKASIASETEAARSRTARIVALADKEIAARRAVMKTNTDTANVTTASARAAADKQIASARATLEAAQTAAKSAKGAAKGLADEQVKQAQRGLVAAQKQGAANVQSAQKLVAGHQQLVQSARRTGAAAIQAANQQVQAARITSNAANQQARAQQQAASRAAAMTNSVNTQNKAMSSLQATVLRLVAAYGGIRVFEGFIKAGLQFNSVMETSKLGIGALITAEAELFDKQGRLLTGTQALGAAQGLAAGQLAKLRIAGIQTAATTEELVTAFQEAVGAGLSVGLTLDQIRGFTVQVAQAASTINLPFNQLNQEVRSILQGTIDRNSRIAKALQLTNEQVRVAKEQGKLADLLNQKFQAFTVAGKESLKTFAALKSNIKDAVSVFAGAATLPLFNQIRDAGQKALAGIFDFDQAKIRDTFTGIISALSAVFREIGSVLADGIGAAVDAARNLSVWLTKHHDEVARTSAAIGTAVREFGKLVSAIIGSVVNLGKFGTKTNAIIGFARVLSGIFQTIRENIIPIAAFLAGQALVKGVIQLERAAAAMVALRAAQVGAGAFGVIALGWIGIIGAVVGGVLLLVSAIKAHNRAQHDARLENIRLQAEVGDTQAAMIGESEAVAQLAFELSKSKAKGKDLVEQQKNLHDAVEDLIKQHPEYAAVLKGTEGDYRAIIRALTDYSLKLSDVALFELEAAEAQRNAVRAKRDAAQTRLNEVNAALAKKSYTERFVVDLGEGDLLARKLRGEVASSTEVLEEQEALVGALTDKYKKLFEAALKVSSVGATVKTKEVSTSKKGKDNSLDDEVQAARGKLEEAKRFADAEEARLKDAEERGIISTIELINQRAELQKAVLNAELHLHEAEKRLAIRKKDAGSEAQAQSEIDAITFKFTQVEAERSRALALAERKNQQLERDIITRRLKASTDLEDRLTGIAREAAAKRADEMRDAVRQLGADNPLVMDLRLVIEKDEAKAQLQELQRELQSIQATTQARIEGIKVRFQGIKLNADQKQQLQDEITAVYADAAASAETIRTHLEDIRLTLTGDPEAQTFIDKLIAQLDALKGKVKNVDLELKRLKEGAIDVLQNSLAGFLEGLGDKTKSIGDLFREMVTGIIRDMQRLVSQILASKIITGIFGAATQVTTTGGGVPVAGGGRIPPRAVGGGFQMFPQGRLSGPGTPTSDSIVARVSRDEYVVQERAARFWGYDFLDALNQMQLPAVANRISQTSPRLAVGGAVLGTSRQSMSGEIHLSLSEDLDARIVRHLEGKAGQRVFITQAASNRKMLRDILGN